MPLPFSGIHPVSSLPLLPLNVKVFNIMSCLDIFPCPFGTRLASVTIWAMVIYWMSVMGMAGLALIMRLCVDCGALQAMFDVHP